MISLVSVILVIVGFILSVYAGIVLSLSNKMQSPSGELSQGRIVMFSIIMSVAVLMVLGGVLGYYWVQGNLPYYLK